jgi:SpoVK/Ycf46/Vps4 family AAA+-type ATPase
MRPQNIEKGAKGVSRINVLVTTASSDFWAEVIAESVTERSDMSLVESRWVELAEVDDILESLASSVPCALVLVGRSDELSELANRWIMDRNGLVVMHVDMGDDIVRIGLRDPRLDSLLSALRELVESVGSTSQERVARIQLRLVGSPTENTAEHSLVESNRPLLKSALNWIQGRFRRAVEDFPENTGDVLGLSVPRAAILQSLDPPSGGPSDADRGLAEDAALSVELMESSENTEPLAVARRVFGFGALEFRLMLLALAPELDLRFQRCVGFLLDEMGRRVGTMALYRSLLDISPHARGELIDEGSLARWRVFEGSTAQPAAADEPLRPDPFLAQWLLGDATALANDPRVRRALQLAPWPGSALLDRQDDIQKAVRLIEELHNLNKNDWLILDAEDSAAWRALIEIGALRSGLNVQPIRVETGRLKDADVLESEECAIRIGRMARLTGHPLIIDVTATDGNEIGADALSAFVAALLGTGCKAAMICDAAYGARLLGTTPYELRNEPAIPLPGRTAAMQNAATRVGASITSESAQELAALYPLQIDRLEHAMVLARSRHSRQPIASDAAIESFKTALKESSSEGVSSLVDRIDPIFDLEQVVLPADRKQQLNEIVEHVRLAPKVLDEWKFREQLPYGRAVAALFSGSSGTGKTMAAMAIARRLGVQILRLELSRVVSKYIGDTEKNIDRVFTDAQRSGAAILIDEADALFGKRSEVKDAHDRYANIEVAYLLQRMEAFDGGLAILTTNMKKNIDPAFMRRLRFVVDFPRPDIDAREKIWRQCLPEESHEVTDGEFRQLARRVDLTGGQIRQTTLRAAFIAAASGELISIDHIAHATQAELAKLGMPPVDIDVTRIRRAA